MLQTYLSPKKLHVYFVMNLSNCGRIWLKGNTLRREISLSTWPSCELKMIQVKNLVLWRLRQIYRTSYFSLPELLFLMSREVNGTNIHSKTPHSVCISLKVKLPVAFQGSVRCIDRIVPCFPSR